MQRTTEAQLYASFILLCNAMNRACYIPPAQYARYLKANPNFPVPKLRASSFQEIGSWSLDYYNGWEIQEMASETGGISMPLGHMRYPLPQFYAMLHFALNAMRYKEASSSPV